MTSVSRLSRMVKMTKVICMIMISSKKSTTSRNCDIHNKLMRAVKYLLIISALVFALSGCNKPADGDAPNSALTSPAANNSEVISPSVTESSQSPDPNAFSAQKITPPDVTKNTATSVKPTKKPETESPNDDDLVRILDYIPSIYVDLKYATTDNFTGKIIYDFKDAYLRYGTVKKLLKIQEKLTEQGYSLKIWDAYRPVSAQFKLWKICPNPKYVANPNKGHSSHSKGNTVDVTLVLLDGSSIEMPSKFDDFSSLADRDYSDVSKTAASNALILENAMTSNGFSGYSGEWWHYSDAIDYSVIVS